jgi:hypothetical protein
MKFIMAYKVFFSSILYTLYIANLLVAQNNDLLNDLENDNTYKKELNWTTATFKSTRIINSHSIENVSTKHLEFRISHRFGQLNQGVYNFFGLDQAAIRLGLEYGVNNRLMVGIGRNSIEKLYDGFLKFKLLRQSSGKKAIPVTVSLFSSIAVNSLTWAQPERRNYFSSRLYFSHQLLVARKFNETFSFQLMPTLIHRNLVQYKNDKNTLAALGAGGRYKLTRRIALNAEYFYLLPNQTVIPTQNSLSIGFDIETGGHVFSLHLTNSPAMVEKAFISETFGSWAKGNIHFGFNISRVFSFVKQPTNNW